MSPFFTEIAKHMSFNSDMVQAQNEAWSNLTPDGELKEGSTKVKSEVIDKLRDLYKQGVIKAADKTKHD